LGRENKNLEYYLIKLEPVGANNRGRGLEDCKLEIGQL